MDRLSGNPGSHLAVRADGSVPRPGPASRIREGEALSEPMAPRGSDGAVASYLSKRPECFARSRCSYAIQGREITSVFSNVPDREASVLSNSPPRLSSAIRRPRAGHVAGGRSAAHGPSQGKRPRGSGRLFVIEAEDSVLEKWKAYRAVLADYSRVAARMNESGAGRSGAGATGGAVGRAAGEAE